MPRWAHPRVTAEDLESEGQRRTRQQAALKAAQRTAPLRDGYLLGLGIAPALTSITALVITVAPGLSGTGDVPIGIVLILLLQVSALAIINQSSLRAWAPSWISVGFLTSVMLPMLAMQMSLLHEPFVSVSLGSAGPALVATAFVVGLYCAFAIWVLWISQGRPEQASILLMPPTLAIPAMMGQAGSIDQHAALVTLSEVTLFTAVVTGIVWLFPGWPQLLAGGAGLAVELLRLWVSGQGPWRSETSGAIVSTVYVALLLLAVLVIVMVPVGDAMLLSHRAIKTRPARKRRRR
jgi:hypothetical protein